MSEQAETCRQAGPAAGLPPPPPGTRYVRVPMCPIIVADDECRRRVDRWFFWPMIVLALAVLPLIAIELLYLDRTDGADREFLGWLCWIGFAMISLAFLVEFLIKIAIAESRLEYLKRNWIDVIIIVIPALRPLRASALVRSSRMFKLRGVGMKLFRYGFTFIVGLEATDRYLKKLGLKSDGGRKPPDRMTRHELMTELSRLRRQCDAWESWYAAHDDYLRARSARESAANEPGRMPPPPQVINDAYGVAAATPSTSGVASRAESAPTSNATDAPGVCGKQVVPG